MICDKATYRLSACGWRLMNVPPPRRPVTSSGVAGDCEANRESSLLADGSW